MINLFIKIFIFYKILNVIVYKQILFLQFYIQPMVVKLKYDLVLLQILKHLKSDPLDFQIALKKINQLDDFNGLIYSMIYLYNYI